MPKRKASFAFPYERPNKLSKRTSSTTVSRTLSGMSKAGSITKKKPLTPVKFPSGTTIMEVAEVVSPTPSLRRASTLTLEEEKSSDGSVGTLSRKGSSKPVSLTKKPSSVEEGALVTRLTRLGSGSIVGETSMAPVDLSTGASRTSLSKKSSSMRSSASDKLPTMPSGLTKFAMPVGDATKAGSLRVTKSTLIADVDETEMESALESLKSTLGKKKSSLVKSTSSASAKSSSSLLKRTSTGASLKSNKSITNSTASDDDAAMETGDGDGDSSASIGAGLPPGGLMEIAISFDTTGSMYGVLEEVRAKIQDLIQRLQADIPGIRISIIAHGDYCDENTTYLIKWIDFGATLPELCDFVKTVERTGGGDGPECYELVLKRAREALSWTPGSQRALVVIGDDDPHEPGYTCLGKTYDINWRDECLDLKKMGVKIYGVQAGGINRSNLFYQDISECTDGKLIQLKDFTSMFDFIMMIAYREANPDMMAIYEQEMRDRSGRLAADVNAFLRADAATTSTSGTSFKFSTSPPAPGTGGGIFPFGTPSLFGAKLGARGKVFGKPSPFGLFSSTTAKKPRKKAATKPAKLKTTTAKAAKIPAKAGTKTGKRNKKAPKTLKKDKVQKREILPDSCVNKGPLKCLTWSKWKKVVVPTLPDNKSKSQYRKRPRKTTGYTLVKWFESGCDTPAIYEFAVQCPGAKTTAGKKYVVYLRISLAGFRRRGSWCASLLRHGTIHKEVEAVLKQGCCIYARQGTTKTRKKADAVNKMRAGSNYIRDNFDYAWKKYLWRKNGNKQNHRLISTKKKGKTVVLSHDTI